MIKQLKKFFYVPKYGKMSEKAFMRNLMLSLSGIFLCMGVMALTAYAYYSSTISSGVQRIRAASYNCEVYVDGTALQEKQLELPKGTYSFSIIKTPDSTATTGFCVITVGDRVFHTQQIQEDTNAQTPFVFTLELEKAQTVAITAVWGTSSYYPGYVLGENHKDYILHEEVVTLGGTESPGQKDIPQTEETDDKKPVPPSDESISAPSIDPTPEAMVYTVEEGDTLSAVAQKYGTTALILQEYNELEDPDLIYVGQIIQIPLAV